jgi:pimeloyl-ACP methyl ester carboxylesterase
MEKPESVILVPGLVCDAAVWREQFSALSGACSLQIAAHELSDSLGRMAERILDTAPRSFSIAGHSMGGRVALEVLRYAPDRVARIALLDTGFEPLDPGEAGERERAGRYRLLEIARRDGMLVMGRQWAHGMVHPSRLADAAFMDVIHQMIARAPLAQYEAQINALLQRPDCTALLSTIRVPTLLLCGREDSWSPLARHVEMARRIAGSLLVEVPDCGHMSTMEQPHAVTRALRAWLEQQ